LNSRAALAAEDVFQQRSTHPLMNPRGVKLRESRDSAEHPNTTSIVFALDVTGSMGSIPIELARTELPKFMNVLNQAGVADPQVMFVAVGDAYSDSAPLQVGQFESTAELMDQWLTFSYLEGHGGGQNCETYELALYFLAAHTEVDSWKKRKKRGIIFLTGDENPYSKLPPHVVEMVIGDRLTAELSVEEIVAEVQIAYELFFIIPHPPSDASVEAGWRYLLGDHVLRVGNAHEVTFVAAGAALLCNGKVTSFQQMLDLLTSAGLEPQSRGVIARALQPVAVKFGVDAPASSVAQFFDRVPGK